MNFLPKELISKIQSNFDSIYDFINYCESDKKNKKFCIEEYKRIITKKGYTKIPSDKIVEKVFNFLKINQGKIPIATANFLFFGGNFNGDIMILFDKILRPFFHEFITPGDNRYNDLFSERKIDETRKTIKKYMVDNNPDVIDNMSIKTINDEIKKIKFIIEIFIKMDINITRTILDYLNSYLSVLTSIKSLKMHNIVSDYIIPIVGIGSLSALWGYGLIKVVQKLHSIRQKYKKIIKRRLKNDDKVKSKKSSKKSLKVSTKTKKSLKVSKNN